MYVHHFYTSHIQTYCLASIYTLDTSIHHTGVTVTIASIYVYLCLWFNPYVTQLCMYVVCLVYYTNKNEMFIIKASECMYICMRTWMCIIFCAMKVTPLHGSYSHKAGYMCSYHIAQNFGSWCVFVCSILTILHAYIAM